MQCSAGLCVAVCKASDSEHEIVMADKKTLWGEMSV